jgi:hypothetical protein
MIRQKTLLSIVIQTICSGLDVAFIRKVLVDSDNDAWVGTILGLYKVHIDKQNNFKVSSMRRLCSLI